MIVVKKVNLLCTWMQTIYTVGQWANIYHIVDLNGWIGKRLWFDANSIGENSFDGYILEVAVEYPDELHELHNDYLLATEKLEISHNILPNYCNSIANKYDIKVGGVNKLVPNLGNKSKYVFHYRNIHLYLLLGMRLVNVHRVLQFKRSTWFNTDKKNAATSFEKDFFKLMNNSTFDKTMENLSKRRNVRLVNNARNYKNYVSKPSFVSQNIFSKNFVAIHKIKPVLTLNKPVYAGFSTFDLSKLLIYKFH